MWTRFKDLQSGGRLKVGDYKYIYIEAGLKEAVKKFEALYHRDPFAVSCNCGWTAKCACAGEDYLVSEHATLDQATGAERGCTYVLVDDNGNRPRNRERMKEKLWAGDLYGRYEERNRNGYVIPLTEFVNSPGVLVLWSVTDTQLPEFGEQGQFSPHFPADSHKLQEL